MVVLSTKENIAAAEMKTSQPKKEYTAVQQQSSFREILRYAWQKSPFYRDYYESHGIEEKHLAEIGVTDLPFMSKELLMENFDRAVTDRRLRKAELEQWIQEVRDPAQTYGNEFVVVHSSGSSGNLAIFVYDRKGWQLANVIMATYLPALDKGLSAKIRIATYLASHGHFAGISTAALLQKSAYDLLVASLLSPMDQVVGELNAFQPHRLSGYSSSIAMLAEAALSGKLKIQPQSIVVSGDLLTRRMERRIQKAWDVPVCSIYASSESNCIGVRAAGQEEMAIVEDLNIVEALDDGDRPVLPGESGRVVLTNLYNRTLPILRYELGDYVVRGKDNPSGFLGTIRSIEGRVNDALPVVLDNGNQDTLHPIILVEFYAQGIEKFQFVSVRPDHLLIKYVAGRDIDDLVRKEFQRLLDMKRARRTTFDVHRVEHIPNDPKTGKFALVKVEHSETYQQPKGITIQSDTADLAIPNLPNLPLSFSPFGKDEIEGSIAARFERQAEKYPDCIAVKTTGTRLTYTELNEAANRLAHAILAKRGQGQEPIALLLENGAPIMAAIFGVLKAGKLYMPLDPSYPQGRIKAMLDNSLAAVILTNNRHLALANESAGSDVEVINVDDLDSSLSGENLELPLSADTLACILYTSGSTGEPKGVVHSHRNILHKTMEYTNALRFCAEDRMALLSPCTFSLSVGFIFGALLNGACLYPVDVKEEGLLHLANWFAEEDISVYNSVPTVFRSFIETLPQGQTLPALRLIHLGGEPVTARDVELYKKQFSPKCTLVHHWGSNETGTIAQSFIDKATPIHGNSAPAGYPGEGSEILVLDDDGNSLGFNHVGEIAVKSRYLAVEYWRNPELTRAVFLLDPAASDKRIYRTGDLGLLRPDGSVEHYGRRDFQVKIRGQRVEVGEIEMALAKHAAIKEALVVAREDIPDNTRLVAYIVPAQKPAPVNRDLRFFLQQRLPEYMVPSAFVFLDSLPLTPNGKLDRKALPELEDRIENDRAGEEYISPRTDVERAIAEVWQEVLGVSRVSAHDNFYDLGGHSLLSLRVVARIEEKIGQRIHPRNLVLQTLRQIASGCEKASTVAERSSTGLIRRWLGVITGRRNR